jgi:uncharacterized protein YcbX
MEVVALYRYPVKSLQGEGLERAEVGAHGIAGDRSHALRDDVSGVVLTARRDPVLLFARGRLDASGRGCVVLPDGSATTDAAVLSSWVGRPVTLVAPTSSRSTYETPVDPEDESGAVRRWEGPVGSYHDSTRTQLSLVAAGEMSGWDVRRFRPNVVVAADSLAQLVGSRIRVGTVELDVVKQIDRCVVVTRAQPGGIDRDLGVFRTIRDERQLFLGVSTMVARQGSLAVGDAVEVLPSPAEAG